MVRIKFFHNNSWTKCQNDSYFWYLTKNNPWKLFPT